MLAREPRRFPRRVDRRVGLAFGEPRSIWFVAHAPPVAYGPTLRLHQSSPSATRGPALSRGVLLFAKTMRAKGGQLEDGALSPACDSIRAIAPIVAASVVRPPNGVPIAD